MKFVAVMLFILTFEIVSFAQATNNLQTPLDLEVLSWYYKDYYNPLNRNYGTSITVDDTAAKERRVKRTDSSQGNVNLPTAPDPFKIGPKAIDGLNYGSIYIITIKNVGGKTIKAVDWDYVFINPEKQNIISQHQFRNTIKLKRGKTKKIKSLTIALPVKVIHIDIIDRNLIEQVIIKRIEYSDGTVWQRN